MERHYYKIKEGDTLYAIARANNCTVDDLCRWNGIKPTAPLKVGTTIMSGFTKTEMPPKRKVHEFFWPASPWENYHNDVGKFLDNQYYRLLGSVHPGNDINDRRGGNSDFNAPVYAITDGVVVDAKFYPVWGNIVVLWHEELGIESLYAHLNIMNVIVGDKVSGGQIIGTFGRGAKNVYTTHLHIEIRKVPVKHVRLNSDFWPSSRFKIKTEAEKFVLDHYLDVVKYLTERGAKNAT